MTVGNIIGYLLGIVFYMGVIALLVTYVIGFFVVFPITAYNVGIVFMSIIAIRLILPSQK